MSANLAELPIPERVREVEEWLLAQPGVSDAHVKIFCK